MSEKSKPPSKQLDENKSVEKKPSVVDRQPNASVQQDASTGAIQKRKSTFKAIKPNSLKNSSSEIDGKTKSLFFSFLLQIK